MQIAVGFVAGLMLGLALLGLAPHAFDHLASPRQGATWLLGGFLLMIMLQHLLPFHHHDVAEGSPLEPCGHTHSLAERSARTLSWMGVALGLSLHSVFDGLATAAAASRLRRRADELLDLRGRVQLGDFAVGGGPDLDPPAQQGQFVGGRLGFAFGRHVVVVVEREQHALE